MATTTLTLAIPACHGASPPDQVAHQTAMTPATPMASSVTTLRHTPADWLASAAARPESSVAIGVFDADRLGRRAASTASRTPMPSAATTTLPSITTGTLTPTNC